MDHWRLTLVLGWLVVHDLCTCTVIVGRNPELQSLLMFNWAWWDTDGVEDALELRFVVRQSFPFSLPFYQERAAQSCTIERNRPDVIALAIFNL